MYIAIVFSEDLRKIGGKFQETHRKNTIETTLER